MAELTSGDPRVRFFDNPKGARHGEEHRHAALSEARGEIVCYLSDDDLWLPEPRRDAAGASRESDFAHTLPLWIDPDGSIHHWRVDLELPFYRELLLGGENRVPHCCAGHTLELYRRLPAGWRAGPEDVPSDLYMWQQILSVPGCRAVSGTRPTVLHFPSRATRGLEQRAAARRARRVGGPRARSRAGATRLPQQVLDAVTVEDARLDEELAAREERLQEQVGPAGRAARAGSRASQELLDAAGRASAARRFRSSSASATWQCSRRP